MLNVFLNLKFVDHVQIRVTFSQRYNFNLEFYVVLKISMSTVHVELYNELDKIPSVYIFFISGSMCLIVVCAFFMNKK